MSEFDEYASTFKALADPLRLRLLDMLPPDGGKSPLCVCELADKLGISQPCLSHHLNVLKGAGLVGFEKDGCSSFYYVDRAHVDRQLEEFRRWMQKQ
ncbi:MAG: metalloregulator ArsR/SmtB family transcription factor [Candidatus Brocadiia bacterium]